MLPALRVGGNAPGTLPGGGMAERTIATVLKTVEPHGSGGSNPPPSANTVPWRSGDRSAVDLVSQVVQPLVGLEGRR